MSNVLQAIKTVYNIRDSNIRFEANFQKSPALPLEFDFLPLKLCVFHIKLL